MRDYMNIYEVAYSEYQRFVKELKECNRFFVDSIFQEYFNKFIESNTIVIEEGTEFFRSRIHKPDQVAPYDEQNMRMPSTTVIASVGRANPRGINYFYVSKNVETTIAEIKPKISDVLTCGKFINKNELRIVCIKDMVGISGAATADRDENDTKIMYFMLLAMSELTKPINEQPELAYLPFQYFAEYCKNSGLNGIEYYSSVRPHDEFNSNYVFFNDVDFDYIDSNVKKIKMIQYDIF